MPVVVDGFVDPNLPRSLQRVRPPASLLPPPSSPAYTYLLTLESAIMQQNSLVKALRSENESLKSDKKTLEDESSAALGKFRDERAQLRGKLADLAQTVKDQKAAAASNASTRAEAARAQKMQDEAAVEEQEISRHQRQAAPTFQQQQQKSAVTDSVPRKAATSKPSSILKPNKSAAASRPASSSSSAPRVPPPGRSISPTASAVVVTVSLTDGADSSAHVAAHVQGGRKPAARGAKQEKYGNPSSLPLRFRFRSAANFLEPDDDDDEDEDEDEDEDDEQVGGVDVVDLEFMSKSGVPTYSLKV